MNKLFYIAFMLLLLASCSLTPQEKIIGKWTGTDHQGQTASFIFYKDKKAEMIQGEYSTKGDAITWEIDDTKNPMYLDLIATKVSEVRRLPLIFRFISDIKIELRMGDDMSVRAKAFSDTDKVNQIILMKQ
ncbi:MAG: hypothetical protein GQ569_04830 [Methylococcaceae bacterium]|nr:hypothetical protein [Methylococcaceae bacterium]